MKQYSMKSLPDGLFSNSTGVYLLVDSGDVVYVGQSRNLALRVSSHIHSEEKHFDSIEFHECDELEMTDLEAMLIATIKPKYNMTIPKCGSYKSYAQVKKDYQGMHSVISEYLEPSFSTDFGSWWSSSLLESFNKSVVDFLDGIGTTPSGMGNNTDSLIAKWKAENKQ